MAKTMIELWDGGYGGQEKKGRAEGTKWERDYILLAHLLTYSRAPELLQPSTAIKCQH